MGSGLPAPSRENRVPTGVAAGGTRVKEGRKCSWQVAKEFRVSPWGRWEPYEAQNSYPASGLRMAKTRAALQVREVGGWELQGGIFQLHGRKKSELGGVRSLSLRCASRGLAKETADRILP